MLALTISVVTIVFVFAEPVAAFFNLSFLSKTLLLLSPNFLVAFSTAVVVLARYSNPDIFPISAYFNIGMTLFFSVSSM